MAHVLSWIGERYRMSYIGQLMELGVQAIWCGFNSKDGNRKQSMDQLIGQIFFTGVEAIPLVAFLALIIGSATILQASTVMPKIGAGDYFGNVMVLVVIREVGPLFTAFLVAGRTGSALSTYLGNMKVQQEIDALKTMGVDPVRYLVYPSFGAIVISMFCLTVVFNLVAIFGGFLVVKLLSVLLADFSEVQLSFSLFVERIFASMGVMDGVLCVVKPLFFGILVSVISCYHGISVSNDIRDVPKATTNGVVNSFVCITLFDTLFALPFLAKVGFL
jgi:phospholipid/cholesterol/gamma-HCH transport system permease protein